MTDQSLFGDDLPEDTHKKCSICKELKCRKTDFAASNSRKDGLHSYCRPCFSAYYTNWARENRWKLSVKKAKERASAAQVPCDITPEYLESIWVGTCPVFDTPLHLPHEGIASRGESHQSKEVPSLDRINPSKGYVPGNVVWISCYANLLKNTATANEILAVGYWLKGVEDNG